MKAKPILLFGGEEYYPCGGWNDLVGSYESPEAALKFLHEHAAEPWSDDKPTLEWWHLVDISQTPPCLIYGMKPEKRAESLDK